MDLKTRLISNHADMKLSILEGSPRYVNRVTLSGLSNETTQRYNKIIVHFAGQCP